MMMVGIVDTIEKHIVSPVKEGAYASSIKAEEQEL
jgi:hypothetical protein